MGKMMYAVNPALALSNSQVQGLSPGPGIWIGHKPGSISCKESFVLTSPNHMYSKLAIMVS